MGFMWGRWHRPVQCSPSVPAGPTGSASLENLLEMRIPGPIQNNWIGNSRNGPRNLCFHEAFLMHFKT